MTIGAFRLNGIAKQLGDSGDFFLSDNPIQSNFDYDVKNDTLEFVGFDNQSDKNAYFVIGARSGNASARPSVLYLQLQSGHGSFPTSPNVATGQGQIEIYNSICTTIPLIGTPSRGANHGATAQSGSELFFTTAAEDGDDMKLKNFRFHSLAANSVSVDTSYSSLQSFDIESTNDIHDYDFDMTSATTGVLFAREDNSNNHSTILYSNLGSSSTPTTTTTTTSTTPYGDNTRYKVLGLANGGCAARGVMIGSGTEPFASFFSYNSSTRTTSNATQISKADDSDSVPLGCRIGANKIVYGIYAPSTDKAYLRCASHSFGGSCATGTTTTGAEIEIDAHDGCNIIEGFEDDRFYMVIYDNSASTVKLITLQVDGTTISQVGGGVSFNAVFTPPSDAYKQNGITKCDFGSATTKFITKCR